MIGFGSLWKNLRPVGIVFGDIGTSPIYALAITFSIIERTPQNIGGVLSLIFWALIFIPTLQYVLLAMNLSLKGEGGQIVLSQILASRLGGGKLASVFLFLSFISVSFFIGDAVITPAISIVSAYEGLHLVWDIKQDEVILFSVLTAFVLFVLQKEGTTRISFLFTPIMIVWFCFLFLVGAAYIIERPSVLAYVSPHHAVKFVLENPDDAFFALTGVILCVTGSEALYADIGHLGKEPVRKSWLFFVFPALVVSYFGQGAYMLIYGARNPFFEHIKHVSEIIYLPAIILTTSATIIASQAVISGLFSTFYQGINVGMFPRLKIFHRSGEFHGQIYIGFVNWLAFVFVVFIMLFFRSSERIGYAYGFAVNMVMIITAFLLLVIFLHKRAFLLAFFSFLVLLVDIVFLSSNLSKLKEGAFISIVIASIPFTTLMVFKVGQARVYSVLRVINFNEFFEEYKRLFSQLNKIPGCAVFLVRDTKRIPPYVMTIMRDMGIIYEENILMTITQTLRPYELEYAIFDLGHNLKVLQVEMGYMEVVDMREVFEKFSINPRAIFYGIEDIITSNPILKLYSVIKKISPSFESFHNFPTSNIHGVITKVRV